MNEYKKVELAKMLESNGSVTLTAVHHETEEVQDIVVTDFDEAIHTIEDLENENEVYF